MAQGAVREANRTAKTRFVGEAALGKAFPASASRQGTDLEQEQKAMNKAALFDKIEAEQFRKDSAKFNVGDSSAFTPRSSRVTRSASRSSAAS